MKLVVTSGRPFVATASPRSFIAMMFVYSQTTRTGGGKSKMATGFSFLASINKINLGSVLPNKDKSSYFPKSGRKKIKIKNKQNAFHDKCFQKMFKEINDICRKVRRLICKISYIYITPFLRYLDI